MQKNAILFLAVIVPLLMGSPSASPSQNRYTNFVPICYQKDGVLVPMRGSCSGFFICVDGNAIASSCGSFYRFNSKTGHCDHPANVNCQEVSVVEQPKEIEPDMYDPEMPVFPIMPTASPPLLVSAPGFPQYLPKPQSPDEAIADEAAGDICRGSRNGELQPKLDSCTQFYVCLLQRPYRRTCPPMLHFNAERRLCQDPILAKCTVKMPNGPIALELVKFGGVACTGMPDGILLPHDDDCTKFYNCRNQERIEMECPSGLHFSVRHQTCEWPKLARCSL